MTLTPRFRFGPITGVESVNFALSRGITPSVCTVQLPLNTAITNYRKPMEMSFSDGSREIKFNNCLIVDIAPSVDGDGFQTMTIAIQDRRWKKSWQIDNERRIVMFGDPVYRVVDSRIASPDLYLRAACHFHLARTREPLRKTKRLKIKNAPDPSLSAWEVRDDLVPEWRKTSTEKAESNIKSEIEPQANYYLQYALAKYQSKVPAHMELPFLHPFSPDGRIAQVTFYIDGEGFIGTTINKELEHLASPVSYRERQQQVQVAQIMKYYEELARTQDEQVRGKQ